jgi:hypothetical protein
MMFFHLFIIINVEGIALERNDFGQAALILNFS